MWDKFRLFSFWMVGCVLVEHAKFENERIVGCHWPNLKLKYIYIYMLASFPTHILVFLMMCYVCYVSMYAETDWQTGKKLNNK